jgi:hypothetical protein
MSSVIISGDTSGAITLAAPAVSGTNTATLPAATGIVMVSGNMPAFSATPTANQAYTSNTWTKVALSAEEFDTNNCFDSTTNYRFTPTVAGYYQFNGYIETNNGSYVQIAIYKNGVLYRTTQQISSNYGTTCSALISLNGSTDYVELYGFITTSGNILTTSNFSGSLARSA